MIRFFYIVLFASFCHSLDIEKPSIYKEQHINGWLMSEKLDGIRAIWNGKFFLSKNGNKIFAPKSFMKDFPPFYLDGELYTKRNDFENIQSIVLGKKPSKQWKQITYNIFEVPYSKGNFQTRLNKAHIWFKKHPNKHVKIIKQIPCKDKAHLDVFLQEIISKNGEGVIIKNPNLNYISSRSKTSLKVKKFFDMEGLIIGHNINNKNNQLKSLIIKLKDGTTFNLGGGFTKRERKSPPKIGETVTFKYYGFTKNNKPKFASFLRVRNKE